MTFMIKSEEMKITQEHILTLNLLTSSVPTPSGAELAWIPIFPDTNHPNQTSIKELKFNLDQETKDAQLNE